MALDCMQWRRRTMVDRDRIIRCIRMLVNHRFHLHICCLVYLLVLVV